MSTNKAKKGDRTRIEIRQINDLASSLTEALETIKGVTEGMKRNQMDCVHPTNYRSGRIGFDDFNRFLGALRAAYLNELGLRADAAAMRELLRENFPDYQGTGTPKTDTPPKKTSRRKAKPAE